jgi:hypothetical protein
LSDQFAQASGIVSMNLNRLQASNVGGSEFSGFEPFLAHFEVFVMRGDRFATKVFVEHGSLLGKGGSFRPEEFFGACPLPAANFGFLPFPNFQSPFTMRQVPSQSESGCGQPYVLNRGAAGGIQ